MNEEIVLKRLKDNLSLLTMKSQLTYFEFQLRFVLEGSIKLIEKQQKEIEDYQILKDDIEGHRIAYVDTPEFEENYISKDKIREKIDLIDKNMQNL